MIEIQVMEATVMVHRHQIQAQLKELGINIKSWGAAEANELPSILMPQEQIKALIHGWYENGFATLVATDLRLLLIDKKLLHLTIEDVRYDMIAEVDYNARLMDSTVAINTLNKQLKFTSMRQRRLRELTTYVQHRVMQLRQHQFTSTQFEEHPDVRDLVQANWITEPFLRAASAVPDLPIPQTTGVTRQFGTVNPYAKQSLTTTHRFLPKIPRRRFSR